MIIWMYGPNCNNKENRKQIRKNKVDEIHVTPIKDSMKNKIIDKREDMSEEEIKQFLKTELENYYEKFGAKYLDTLSNDEKLYYIDIS